MIKIQNTPNMADPKIQEEEQKILEEKIQEYAGKVEEYVDPGKLEWFGAEVKKRACGNKADFISISKTFISVSSPLGKLLNPENKDSLYVKIGFSKNGAMMAVRADSKDGLNAARDKKSSAVRISFIKGLKPLFAERGWPEKCRAEAWWDERAKMVVAKRPDEGKQMDKNNRPWQQGSKRRPG